MPLRFRNEKAYEEWAVRQAQLLTQAQVRKEEGTLKALEEKYSVSPLHQQYQPTKYYPIEHIVLTAIALLSAFAVLLWAVGS